MTEQQLLALCRRLSDRHDPEIDALINALASLLADLATARALLTEEPREQTLLPLPVTTATNQPEPPPHHP